MHVRGLWFPSRRSAGGAFMLAIMAMIMIAGPALSQRALSKADVAGEWTGPISLDAGTQTIALVFRVVDSTLAGTVYSNGEKFGDMTNVTLSGNTVHFKMQQLDFTCTIDGVTMKVALIVFNGSTRHLTLKKTPGPPL